MGSEILILTLRLPGLFFFLVNFNQSLSGVHLGCATKGVRLPALPKPSSAPHPPQAGPELGSNTEICSSSWAHGQVQLSMIKSQVKLSRLVRHSTIYYFFFNKELASHYSKMKSEVDFRLLLAQTECKTMRSYGNFYVLYRWCSILPSGENLM